MLKLKILLNNIFSKVLANLTLTDTCIKYNGILWPRPLKASTRPGHHPPMYKKFKSKKINCTKHKNYRMANLPVCKKKYVKKNLFQTFFWPKAFSPKNQFILKRKPIFNSRFSNGAWLSIPSQSFPFNHKGHSFKGYAEPFWVSWLQSQDLFVPPAFFVQTFFVPPPEWPSIHQTYLIPKE